MNINTNLNKINKQKITLFNKEINEEYITISIEGIGKVVICETTPKYEGFIDDIGEEKLKKYGIDEDDFILTIESLNINKKFANKGYGKKLMNKTIIEIKNKMLENTNFKYVFLNSCPFGDKLMNLEDLTNFYGKFGFKIIKNQKNNNLMFSKIDELIESN